MYDEIVRDLMEMELLLMVFYALLFLVIPISGYIYTFHKEKKKKKKRKPKKKRNNLIRTPEQQALVLVISGILFFCVFFGITLYECLSLREDMVNQNYVTYTGEFEHETHRGSKGSSTSYVEFTDENGEDKNILHNFHIDDFQTCEHDLHDGKYRGTIVYSPSSNLLLWWDAVPIED